ETIINNAAREPEIVALAEFLKQMGVPIEGLGTTSLRVMGQSSLQAVQAAIIPDRIEAGTFLVAGALLGNNLRITGIRPDHLQSVLEHLEAAGVSFEIEQDAVTLSRPDKILPVDVVTGPYPEYPTDLQAQWITFMCHAAGSSRITDTIYLDRFAHVPEMVRLGARITLESNTALVEGPANLVGAPVMSTDIRASAALVLAALIAEGTTEISRVYHIDRGYETIERKFAALGARIRRSAE
ncbi:MAG: UDP-N-acetylglucosamine 1-carboxyvinyltransferase, partial [Candidatus Marinimicrobia bacterium]|nr:UDP-N-acetylglucosamine 1-carboxyvinyltransferase [Candidatus Neomarinimicrobiota bacterium]